MSDFQHSLCLLRSIMNKIWVYGIWKSIHSVFNFSVSTFLELGLQHILCVHSAMWFDNFSDWSDNVFIFIDSNYDGNDCISYKLVVESQILFPLICWKLNWNCWCIRYCSVLNIERRNGAQAAHHNRQHCTPSTPHADKTSQWFLHIYTYVA